MADDVRSTDTKARVLVVEDQALIALDLAQQLEDAGFEPLGPATSVKAALGMIRDTGCELAVLDVHLGSETSEPIAEVLRAQGTPFVVVSGYSTESLSKRFGGAPVLMKPPNFEVLAATLREAARK